MVRATLPSDCMLIASAHCCSSVALCSDHGPAATPEDRRCVRCPVCPSWMAEPEERAQATPQPLHPYVPPEWHLPLAAMCLTVGVASTAHFCMCASTPFVPTSARALLARIGASVVVSLHVPAVASQTHCVSTCLRCKTRPGPAPHCGLQIRDDAQQVRQVAIARTRLWRLGCNSAGARTFADGSLVTKPQQCHSGQFALPAHFASKQHDSRAPQASNQVWLAGMGPAFHVAASGSVRVNRMYFSSSTGICGHCQSRPLQEVELRRMASADPRRMLSSADHRRGCGMVQPGVVALQQEIAPEGLQAQRIPFCRHRLERKGAAGTQPTLVHQQPGR